MPSNEGLVDFHPSRKRLSPRSNHRTSELVQTDPGGAVGPEFQHALEPESARARLLARHPPDGPEPDRQRRVRSLEDGAGRHRGLVPTAGTEVRATPRGPGLRALAVRADEAVRPAEVLKGGATRLLGLELALQSHQILGVVGHRRQTLPVGATGDNYLALCGKVT